MSRPLSRGVAQLNDKTVEKHGAGIVPLEGFRNAFNNLLKFRLVDKIMTALIGKYVLNQGAAQLVVGHSVDGR